MSCGDMVSSKYNKALTRSVTYCNLKITYKTGSKSLAVQAVLIKQGILF